jgi:ADP-heptose:LPS heptosyltransferase
MRGAITRTCLVHLASGVGNIVLATPLLVALDELGLEVEVCLDADYAQTAALLQPWSVVRAVHVVGVEAVARRGYDVIVPALPPFYWGRFARSYALLASRRGSRPVVVARPPNALFASDEQAYYLAFARALGAAPDRRPVATLPIGPAAVPRLTADTVVLAPGCKTGIMASKRWPHFAALADRFDDVAVVGTGDDLRHHDGLPMCFPAHARLFVDRLTLRETAELLAEARVVVANDSGLAHVAAAVGAPTLMLFGPTDHACLGPLAPNVTVLRAGLPCEPCWTTGRLVACGGRVDCLKTLAVEAVAEHVNVWLGRAAASGEERDEHSIVRAG